MPPKTRPSIGFDSKSLRALPPEQRYLVGVSGGRDSVALLHWLLAHGYRKLIVCHLEHGLRGRAGRDDARFVERLAREARLQIALSSENIAARAASHKQSIETAARAARYEFFARIARRRRCHAIFLGHHADDLVETFLFNLFRGAGPAGLAAMRATSLHRPGGVELSVLRPLLSTWRREIDAYVKTHRLAFREDATNRSLGPMRNRMRLRVIPYLEKSFGRNLRVTIWRSAMIAAEEEAWLETTAAPGLAEKKELAVHQLRSVAIALQRRTILQWLRAQSISDPGYEVVEQVRALLEIDGGAPAKINLPRDRHARRRAGRIFIE